MNPRHELVNWDGAAGLTIDEAIDWLSHCHHSQQVSQNQVNKDVFLQHVVRRFRWVFALAWGQDRIVIAFLQKWLQFMSTYSKHNQTISSRGKRRHAWSLFLNKCCKRWWFIADAYYSKSRYRSPSIYWMSYFTLSIFAFLARGSGRSGCGEISASSFRFWDLLWGGRRYTAAEHYQKKKINNGVKVQRNPLCAKKI